MIKKANINRVFEMKNNMSVNNIRMLTVIALFSTQIYFSGCVEKKPEVTTKHVGILSGLEYISVTAESFIGELGELGFVEGENIVFDLQKTDFDMANYQHILKQFVADSVDLIFVFPTEASQEAKIITGGTGIPVVFAVANIEGTELVENVRNPGGNVTGVRYPGPDIAIKRFEIMMELLPETKRICVPYQRDYPIVASQLTALQPVAKKAGVSIVEMPAADAAELEQKFDQLSKSRIDAILFLAEPLTVVPEAFRVIGKFAAENKIPVGGVIVSIENYTTLFGVNIDPVNTGKQAAQLTAKILKGTAAGTIPVLSSESYIQINYKAATEMGIAVPEGLLSRSDEIIR